MKKLLFACLLVVISWGNCGNSQQDSALFEYREVYLPELPSNESKILDLNSVDRDWGIWGHNLSIVLPKNPSPSVYAKAGNSVNQDQFCFTSDALFNYIKTFIDDNYGNDKTVRFAILPNDNSIVCLCPRCVECGNTAGDASGAVYNLLERLTEAYPKHLFFTSYYRTATGLPRRALPDNAGVLISAMSYPLSTVHTPQEDEFKQLLKQWSGFTKRIYIWDYINNFDDYFTPFPVFEVIQRRLRLYADNGVKGVFFNGSGPDYSSMSRVKIHVISALFDNPDLDWRPVLKDLCYRMYPVTGKMISDFMIRQEDMIKTNGKSLPLYDGIVREVKTYLPAAEFEEFHSEIINILPHIKDPERSEIQQLSRAMMFTHLELMRISADTLGARRMLVGLERLVRQGVLSYSEAGGSTESYLSDYRYMLKHIDETGKRNLLKGVRVEPLTALDEDYSDISILTDGMLGLPSSYHCGQMLSSADPALRLAIPHVDGMRHLRVHLTRNGIYHIALPLSVSLSVDGHEISKKVPKPLSDNNHRSVVEFDVPSGSNGSLVLTIVRNKDERTMAIDEIEGFK